MKMYTAIMIGRNSRQPKIASWVERNLSSPSAVSARRMHVLRYTANVAMNTAAEKILKCRLVIFLERARKSVKQRMKTANENTWNARPASKM